MDILGGELLPCVLDLYEVFYSTAASVLCKGNVSVLFFLLLLVAQTPVRFPHSQVNHFSRFAPENIPYAKKRRFPEAQNTNLKKKSALRFRLPE